MPLNYVELTLDLYDGSGGVASSGTAWLKPTVTLTDAGVEIVTQNPVPAVFTGIAPPVVSLLATDNASVLPAGWAWNISFSNVSGAPATYNFFLPYTGGSAQSLSSISAAATAVTTFPLNPMTALGDMIYGGAAPAGLPERLQGNTTTTREFLTQTGTGAASAAPVWGVITASDLPPALGNVADTGTAGFALQNATPTILSWTAPSDANLHPVLLTLQYDVTSSASGGAIYIGGVVSGEFVAPDLGVGIYGPGGGLTGWPIPGAIVLRPGQTITLEQASALTAGAVTVYAQIWAA